MNWVACRPAVVVTHEPVVARASDPVTFSAELKNSCGSPTTVDIIVNGVVVQTCSGMRPGDVCVYRGGPYGDYRHWLVSGGRGDTLCRLRQAKIFVLDFSRLRSATSAGAPRSRNDNVGVVSASADL